MRAQLAALRDALDALETDPSSDRVAALLRQRDASDRAFARFASSGARIPRGAQEKMESLLVDVDQLAADPIGQRARLAAARQRIEQALAQPETEQPLSTTLELAPVDRGD